MPKSSVSLFRFSLFVNLLIIVYSTYQVKINDSEWWGYTLFGTLMLTVMLIFSSPSEKVDRETKLHDLLTYPICYLFGVISFFNLYYNLGLLILSVFLTCGIVAVITGHIQKLHRARDAIVYFATIATISWIFLYKYYIIPLAYTVSTFYFLGYVIELMKPEGRSKSAL